MFICLSSGGIVQYRQDILRALAVPSGAQLQFRYDSKWIAKGVRDKVELGQLAESAALIAYIDQHDKTKSPELVPCRFARITHTEAHGTTASLILTVEDFAYCEDLAGFNSDLQLKSKGILPKWTSNDEITGSYWLEVTNAPPAVSKSSRLGDWEKIVSQLGSHDEFACEKCFYTLLGVHELGSSQYIAPENGVVSLEPNVDYECRIYHFLPKSAELGASLRLETPSGALVRFTTNPTLKIDSRYDMKHVRFKTGRPTDSEESFISIHRIENGGDDFGYWDFDLPVKISGTFFTTLGYGAALGALLAAPQTVAALSNPNLTGANRAVIVLVAWVSCLLAGVFAAFGIRKAV